MLVLTRQKTQSIMIGDAVEVTVVDVRGEKVRLGITAPRNIAVHRKEIYTDILEENKAAAASVQTGDLPNPTAIPAPISAADAMFMKAAVDEAKLGLSEGGLPIGSVLVRDGQIVARGHNRRVQNKDPMAHAEIDCLTKAGRQKTYRDTVLYSTLMPCHLCTGAVLQFGIPRVVAGESVNFPGAADMLRSHQVEVVDLHDPVCIQMMNDFIRANSELWNEDIGK